MVKKKQALSTKEAAMSEDADWNLGLDLSPVEWHRIKGENRT